MKRFGFLIRYLWVLALVWLGGMTLCVAPREARVSTRENRMLAAAPALTFDAVMDGSFMADTETWLSDAIVLREPLIDLSRGAEGLLALPTDSEEEAQALIDAIDAEMNATPAQKSAVPTAHTTPLPTAVPTAAETAQTPEPTTEPTPTPAITDTSFRIEFGGGQSQTLASYAAKDLYRAAEILNAYRELLPDDGCVVFTQVPVASMGNAFLSRLDRDPVWRSDTEDALQSLVRDGVFVVDAAQALNGPLKNGEYVYFRTDHHWTARGAYCVYRAMMERLGIPPSAYDDYAYTVRNGMRGNHDKPDVKADTLEVMQEIEPVRSYVVSHLTDSVEVPFMDLSWNSYLAFLGGTKTPWRRFETGAQTGRTALLIGDSYANALLPYLLVHYDRVLMTDLRFTSYDPDKAGASVSTYMKTYGVDDVYFVFCLATGIDSSLFTGGQLLRYLY